VTSKEGLPNLYCGLLPVLLLGVFLVAKNIRLREKIAAVLLLAIINVLLSVEYTFDYIILIIIGITMLVLIWFLCYTIKIEYKARYYLAIKKRMQELENEQNIKK